METQKQSNLKTYKITEILHDSICKNNSHNVILKLNGHLITFGFMGMKPFEGDIIECDLIPRDDHTSYKFNTYKVYLPLGEIPQIQRINKILQGENYEYNYNTIKNYFAQFEYGDKFWLNLFGKYNGEKNTGKIYEPLNIIGTHAAKYYNSLIRHFSDELEKLGIKLYHKQLMELYTHPKFGFNVTQWDGSNLFELFSIDCFTIKTVLNIAAGMKLGKVQICELIIVYCLSNSYNGSTCVTNSYYKIMNEIMNQKDLTNTFDSIQKILTEKNFEKIIGELIEKKAIGKIGNYLYAKNLFEAEMAVGKIIGQLNLSKSIVHCLNLNIDEINGFVNGYEVKPGLFLNTQQKTGIAKVFTSPVSVIYGKAGTGKSSLLAGLLNTIEYTNSKFSTQQIQVFFLTPTAKAKMKLYSDILKDYTRYRDNIRTINSWNYLGTSDKSVELKPVNLFVVDETSMVDINLMGQMLEILMEVPNVSVLFLGDIRQLPSIGPGDFLNNLIQSECVSTTELTQVVRNGGIITDVLDKITEGTMLVPSDYTDTPGFQWIIPTSKNYLELISKSIKTPSDMIISATNRTISDLTDEIRKIKNPNEKSYNSFKYIDKDFNKITLKVDDPVILGQNFNADGLFNGMTGKVIEISNSYNVTKMSNITKIKVQFEEGFFTFDSDSEYIKHLKPAYMITVHKSQGQEYPNIIVVLSESQLLNRNTLYTAISRAKNSVCLIVTEKILAKAIKRKNKRKCLLVPMLKYYAVPANLTMGFDQFFNQYSEKT